ncbi:MAG: Transcriptional regulator, BadM/Rrf2 family [Parcubacteria group bacterium GW2011_GWD2_38_12]|nr:MAG: Transcriptional regulator, BadM/Rrf2 family [Parcubacteria group bacterium GW2011_GWC2_36_17]KKQ39367.1 MAG: Transcriptional regulator, BadM/Rrf2 family [Candidatus Moranbacteria bacterium GW2011_GWF2_37_7]KKQ51873.1 MAG: Transcriptional regulator, BadM/Rrf2 family [Parcubacteria group bacterium GW2011_GWD2_38_12]KKQ58028.1 MAG: Transcriptional regulator, BadM/Rrf2 family [Parcubacteria group bacterium GW2011_GWD1_38_16]KKQ58653.1 MAG: Transcriptional regulator, BadM/Rrf2 family [Parcub
MIIISAKIEYGIFLLVYLVGNSNRLVSLTEVAEQEKISRGYLEEVAANLKRMKILNGKKGRGGGYILARDPRDIKISEIITALEGPISPVKCLDLPAGRHGLSANAARGQGDLRCVKEKKCGTKKIWISLKNKIEEHLSEISLADII